MKPGSQEHTIALETVDDLADLSEALVDFTDSAMAGFLDKKLDEAILPLELDPEESALALKVLRAAASHFLTGTSTKSRLNSTLGQFDGPA